MTSSLSAGICCPTCGQPRPHGPQTYEEFMDEYYAAEVERAYGPPKPLPIKPPPGWDWDLWSEFRMGVEAMRHG